MGVPDEPLMMGTPGFDLISFGLVDADKIPKYELTVEDGRKLAKEYSRFLMRKHRARQAAETNLLRSKKEAIEALPYHLKMAALVPDLCRRWGNGAYLKGLLLFSAAKSSFRNDESFGSSNHRKTEESPSSAAEAAEDAAGKRDCFISKFPRVGRKKSNNKPPFGRIENYERFEYSSTFTLVGFSEAAELKAGGKALLQDPIGEVWSVRVTARDAIGRQKQFSGGWTEFIRENGVEVGDRMSFFWKPNFIQVKILKKGVVVID
ncbi:hypothetical protein LINGRAHAP2_LOCUS11564 [Linum grandiflorum]